MLDPIDNTETIETLTDLEAGDEVTITYKYDRNDHKEHTQEGYVERVINDGNNVIISRVSYTNHKSQIDFDIKREEIHGLSGVETFDLIQDIEVTPYEEKAETLAASTVLTERNADVHILSEQGRSRQEIADMLDITTNTVDEHRQSIKNRIELAQNTVEKLGE